MKRFYFLFLILIAIVQSGKSQTSDFELGVRLGYAVSADMVFNLDPHRIHTNIGWGVNYYMFDNYFDFMFPIYREEWFIYAGIGAGVRYWDKKRSNYDGFGVALLGELGVEWHLRKHFNIGLDVTPAYDVIKEKFNNYGSLCLRYRF